MRLDLQQPDDEEATLRRALLDEFDSSWPAIGRSFRARPGEHGMAIDATFEAAEAEGAGFRAARRRTEATCARCRCCARGSAEDRTLPVAPGGEHLNAG